MSATELLQRLEYVRAVGVGRWSGRCPVHGDRDPSRSITDNDDGTVVIHCHAGCSASERIVLAICEADRIAGKKLTREQLAREAQAWLRVHGSGRRSA